MAVIMAQIIKNKIRSPRWSTLVRVEGCELQLSIRFPRIGLRPPSGRTGINILVYTFTLMLPLQIHGIFDYDRAISKSQKGDWQQSKEILKNILIENPENSELLYDMGVSSFKSNEPEKALSYFSKAAESSDASLREKAHYNAGNAHVQLKQLQEAIDAYDRALALNPSNKHAAHNKEVVKKMLEEQKEKEKKDEQDKQDKDNKEKQDQENNQDKNNKDSEKNTKDNQKKDQDNNKQNNEKNKNQQEKSGQNKSQEEKEKEKKEQDAKNKEEEQKQQQEKKEAEERNKQENASNNNQSGKKDNEEKNKQPKLSPALNRLLNEQEKKDAALNKQMIKAMAGTYTGATDGNNCW